MSEPVRFVLASASPARLETLLRAGVVPEVIVSHVDESLSTGATPAELVQKLATAKMEAVAAQLDGPVLVLGCDSMLEFEGAMLGKPDSPTESRQRWRRMRGRRGALHTGHCLGDLSSGRSVQAVVTTYVRFADVTDWEIDLYVASGEPANVAGAFTIDGLGGWFVESVDGDHHNVVGLSLPVLRTMLGELGYGLHDLGYPTR